MRLILREFGDGSSRAYRMKVVHRVETLGDVIQHCHHHLDSVPDEGENELLILIELSLNILRGD
jgi:hypothetical protein